jgi:MFS family permease
MTQLCFWAGQASFFVVLALYLQNGRGLHPLPAGLVFTILAAAYVAASMRAPALTARHGRAVIGVGALVLAAGHALLLAAVSDVGVGGSLAVLVPGLVLVGAGMGFVLAPLASTILHSLEPERAGAASGMLTTMQNVGNALGVAVTGVIFFGALHSGYATAFELAVGELAVLLVGVAALTRLLPGRA